MSELRLYVTSTIPHQKLILLWAWVMNCVMNALTISLCISVTVKHMSHLPDCWDFSFSFHTYSLPQLILIGNQTEKHLKQRNKTEITFLFPPGKN